MECSVSFTIFAKVPRRNNKVIKVIIEKRNDCSHVRTIRLFTKGRGETRSIEIISRRVRIYYSGVQRNLTSNVFDWRCNYMARNISFAHFVLPFSSPFPTLSLLNAVSLKLNETAENFILVNAFIAISLFECAYHPPITRL